MSQYKYPDLTEIEKLLLHQLSMARYIIGRVRTCGETFEQYQTELEKLQKVFDEYEYKDGATQLELNTLSKLYTALYIINVVKSGADTFGDYHSQIESLDEFINKYIV